MKKEKTIKAHSRKTKSGKTVQVKQHTAKYDSADEMAKKAMLAREGAGKELAKRKKAVAKPAGEEFNAEDFKAWYHWDMQDDPKNEQAKKVEKCLKKKMGTKAYNKYLDDMTESYTARGHTKAFKSLDLTEGKSTPVNSKAPVAKSKQVSGTDKASSDKVINSIVKNYKGASDTVLNRMTKEALAVDGKEDTFSKEWSRTKKLGILKKGLSTSDLTPEDFEALHKKSLRYAKETPKSKPTGMYTRDKFLEEMRSGKIPSLAHRAEPKIKTTTGGKTTELTLPEIQRHLNNVLSMDRAIKKGSKSNSAITKGKASEAYLKKIGFLGKDGNTKMSWGTGANSKLFEKAAGETKGWS